MLTTSAMPASALQVLQLIKALPSKRMALLHLVDFSRMHQEELRAVQRYAGHMLGLHLATNGSQQQDGASSTCSSLDSSCQEFWQAVYNRSSFLALQGACCPLPGLQVAAVTSQLVSKGESADM